MQTKRKKRLAATLLLVITSLSVFLVYAEIAGVFPFNNSNGHRYILPPGGKIAFVKPVFTSTAYEVNGFYTFYNRHTGTPNGTYVTTDFNMLNLTVKDDWGWSRGLGSFINSDFAKNNNIRLGNNSFVISDIDVNNGALFNSNGTRAYDVAVVGFDEYVTDAEFNQYIQFVHSGGRLIFLDAATFLGKVDYNPATNRIIFVESHGWIFNGTAAWAGVYDHYKQDSAKYFGSVFSLFKTGGYSINGAILNTTHPLSESLKKALGPKIITTYRPHEENALSNLNDQIIAYWDVTNLPQGSQDITVAVYQLNLGNGTIIQTGIMGSDIIDSNRDLQLFLIGAIGIATLQTAPPVQIFVDTDRYVYSVGDKFTIFGNISASVIIGGVSIDVQITAPNGSLWGSTLVPLNPDGSFQVDSSTVFQPLDQVGNYTVTANYNGITASSNFTVMPAPCTIACDVPSPLS